MSPNERLPVEFVDRLRDILGPSTLDACLQGFRDPKWSCFFVNTLLSSTTAVCDELSSAGVYLTAVPWCEGAFWVRPENRRALLHSTALAEHRLYVQNASSLLPPLVLAPNPEDAVLDLAAAPGGKTIHLACLMKNRGPLSAVEVVRSRFYKLTRNLADYGVANVRTYFTDGRTVGRKKPEQFDRVLLDAPCSGEARFRVDQPESWAYWSMRKIREQSRKQRGLLQSAFRALKPGGTLVYATCSFAPEENECAVSHLLNRFPGCVQPIPIEMPLPNVIPGLTHWQGRELDRDLRHSCRVLPDERLDGFFLCRLVKTDSVCR